MPEYSSSTERQDLGDRTAIFARRVRVWCKKLPTAALLAEDIKQLLRSSGSVGANYIEANEALSKKDCAFHLKICRKEAKESAYWLTLLNVSLPMELESERKLLLSEAQQLKRIFSTILLKHYT